MSLRPFPELLTYLLLAGLFVACEKEGTEITQYFTVNVPIYALRKDVQDSIGSLPPRAMCTPGNIYARGTLLFVNEGGRGWHVIDNGDARRPRPLAYWQIPGSRQLAFVDGKVVTDNYGDLVALEVSADLDLKVHSTAANLLAGHSRASAQDPAAYANLITGYRLETHQYTYRPDDQVWDADDLSSGIRSLSSGFADRLNASSGGVEAQGSLSRFASYRSYIYSVEDNSTGVYRLTDSIRAITVADGSFERPVRLRGGETALVDGDQLFIGTPLGMHIYSLDDPALPVYASTFQHTFGCDPVAVSGDRAVVTVRDGAECRSSRPVNALYVVDITNPQSPVELSRTNLTHPHGVAIHGDRLYVSEGEHGLKVFGFSGVRDRPGRLLAESKVPSVDVMVLPYDSGTKLLSISRLGIAQYATSAAAPLALESTLTTVGCP